MASGGKWPGQSAMMQAVKPRAAATMTAQAGAERWNLFNFKPGPLDTVSN